MRVILQYGNRHGEEVFLQPAFARRLIDDGRAVAVPQDGEAESSDSKTIENHDPIAEHRDPRPGTSRDEPRPARRRR